MDDPGDAPGGDPGEWCSVRQAARRLGITEKAVRGRIERDSIRWRPKGNHGREVWVERSSPGEVPGDGPSDAPEDDPSGSPGDVELLVAVARLEERVVSLTSETNGLRARLEVERQERERLLSLVEQALRPWPVRLVEAFRRRSKP